MLNLILDTKMAKPKTMLMLITSGGIVTTVLFLRVNVDNFGCPLRFVNAHWLSQSWTWPQHSIQPASYNLPMTPSILW